MTSTAMAVGDYFCRWPPGQSTTASCSRTMAATPCSWAHEQGAHGRRMQVRRRDLPHVRSAPQPSWWPGTSPPTASRSTSTLLRLRLKISTAISSRKSATTGTRSGSRPLSARCPRLRVREVREGPSALRRRTRPTPSPVRSKRARSCTSPGAKIRCRTTRSRTTARSANLISLPSTRCSPPRVRAATARSIPSIVTCRRCARSIRGRGFR